MKLEHKAGLSVFVALAVMVAVVSVMVSQVVWRSFQALEVEQAQARVESVRASIVNENEGLARTAKDYAEWVDTSQFLVDRNAAYLIDNYTAESMRNIRVDHALLFAADGTYVDGRSAPKPAPEAVKAAPELVEVVRPLVNELVRAQEKAVGLTSVLRGPEELLLVAAQPVISLEDAVFPGGVLVLVRRFDAEVVARLVQLHGVPVRVDREHAEEHDHRENQGEWELSGNDLAVNRSAEGLLAHFSLRDWQRQAVGWVHVELDRAVSAQGRRIGWWLVGVVVVTGGVFALLLLLLLRRLVIRRLHQTCDELAVIAASARPEGRLTLDGDDEMTRLARSVNTMLAALAQAQAERDRREQEQRGLEQQLLHAQKLEVVGTFAGGIAHDFNNYLCAIQGWLTLARNAERDGLPQADYLAHAERALQQGALLARRLLLFSRREEPKLSEVSLGTVVRESMDLIRVALPKGVHVKVTVEGDDRVRADASQLQQVLINLAVNASDAMDHVGTIEITVAARHLPDAEAPGSASLQPGAYGWVRVKDSGPGIPPEVLPRIFEPFFTTKPTGKGTGLGLAVVHRIIQACGGVIEVQTSRGRGTTFHLYLPSLGRAVAAPVPESVEPTPMSTLPLPPQPLPEPPPVVAAAPAKTDASIHEDLNQIKTEPDAAAKRRASEPADKGCVLIVEDDAMVRQVWVAALKMADYRPVEAVDGVQAWQLLQTRSGEFAVVVTDHVMPNMTGLELGARAFVAFPGLPVVMLTAVLPMTAPELEAKGFFAALTKPISMGQLVEVVTRAAASRR